MKAKQNRKGSADHSAANFEMLVDELMKDQPDQDLVQKLMTQFGIPYTKDVILQMGSVLQAMEEKRLEIL